MNKTTWSYERNNSVLNLKLISSQVCVCGCIATKSRNAFEEVGKNGLRGEGLLTEGKKGLMTNRTGEDKFYSRFTVHFH
jgi:hypothetical protein